jgi:putative membrane protein
MTGFLGEGYLWVSALHIVAVITWMVGMAYLPYLFAYHCRAEPGSGQSETFKVMEHRLLRYVTNPAMIAAWILGLSLAAHLDIWDQAWFHGKFVLLVVMQVIHAAFARWRRHFAGDGNRHEERYYRWISHLPNLVMIGIVILVVVKPF